MTRLRGALTAIVTPFDARGEVDERALRGLTAWQVERGIHGVAPCGTTGEGATLRPAEHERVVAAVVETVAGRVPVVAGCGTNDTRTTVEGARRAARAGADALLVVSPYYNKPNLSGMVDHFRAVTEAAGIPVVVYNVPGRTGQNLGAAWILRLAEIPGVSGVKEAAANLEQLAEILEGRREDFSVLSGDDALAMPAAALGADGVVSVVANEAPGETAEMLEAVWRGDLAEARAIHFRLLPLMRANFLESNPVPVKVAMELLGRCSSRVRPPLGRADSATRERVASALARAGLLAESR
jgi:4-hydroxy-tetrahydrodipicolinate synthase